MTKKAQQYIDDGDLKGAIQRYQVATGRWREHWWNTITAIYETCDIFEKICYIINYEAHSIADIRDFVNPSTPKSDWCYWIEIFEDDKLIYNKIGTTTQANPLNRLDQIITKGWRDTKGELKYKIKRLYRVNADLEAEGLESLFRAKLCFKYKGLKKYVKNDRFAITNAKDEPSIAEMDAWALEYGATIIV